MQLSSAQHIATGWLAIFPLQQHEHATFRQPCCDTDIPNLWQQQCGQRLRSSLCLLGCNHIVAKAYPDVWPGCLPHALCILVCVGLCGFGSSAYMVTCTGDRLQCSLVAASEGCSCSILDWWPTTRLLLLTNALAGIASTVKVANGVRFCLSTQPFICWRVAQHGSGVRVVRR